MRLFISCVKNQTSGVDTLYVCTLLTSPHQIVWGEHISVHILVPMQACIIMLGFSQGEESGTITVTMRLLVA